MNSSDLENRISSLCGGQLIEDRAPNSRILIQRELAVCQGSYVIVGIALRAHRRLHLNTDLEAPMVDCPEPNWWRFGCAPHIHNRQKRKASILNVYFQALKAGFGVHTHLFLATSLRPMLWMAGGI
jgi:hypothetical protein